MLTTTYIRENKEVVLQGLSNRPSGLDCCDVLRNRRADEVSWPARSMQFAAERRDCGTEQWLEFFTPRLQVATHSLLYVICNMDTTVALQSGDMQKR